MKHGQAYQEWILANVDQETQGYGDCERVVEAMVAAFPGQLAARKGFFHSTSWGQRGHWWCLDVETGLVVDPTGRQHPEGAWFPSRGNLLACRYEDLTDLPQEELARRVPSGPCANCGGPRYDDPTVCSDECGREYVQYIMSETGAVAGDSAPYDELDDEWNW